MVNRDWLFWVTCLFFCVFWEAPGWKENFLQQGVGVAIAAEVTSSLEVGKPVEGAISGREDSYSATRYKSRRPRCRN